MTAKLTVLANPKASSGLGTYVVAAIEAAGCPVHTVNPAPATWSKLVPVIRSMRWDREAMWKARWENLVFSSRAWDRNTRQVGRRLERMGALGGPILMVGKEYYPHPDYRNLSYSIFIHHNMKLALSDGVTPWLPPRHDIDRFVERETNLYRHARYLFVGGRFLADHLVSEYGVSRERIVIAGGGPQPYFEAHPNPSVPAVFTNQLVFVGWDFGMKGGRDLLMAFAMVRRQRPGTRLVIAGPDAKQWVEQDGVTWLGPIRDPARLVQIYRESDLFVMPSLRDSFGFVFLEAMTQGLPCIGANINAMPEIIEHEKTGYVVPRNDPEALAAAVLRYYEDPGNRARMGAEAISRVQERYTWTRVARLVIQSMELSVVPLNN